MQNPVLVADTDDPESVLSFISEQKTGIFLLCDYAPHITPYGQEDSTLVRRLREIAWKLNATKATIVFVGLSFPDLKTLEKEVTQIELGLPQESEIEESIEMQLENLKSSGLNINLTNETQIALLQALLLIDGAFKRELAGNAGEYRGSSNQRMIFHPISGAK